MRPEVLTHPALSRTIRLICRTGNPIEALHCEHPNPLGSGLRQSVWKVWRPTVLRQTKPKARSPMGFLFGAPYTLLQESIGLWGGKGFWEEVAAVDSAYAM